jgi:predicted nucleic acid-binding protein
MTSSARFRQESWTVHARTWPEGDVRGRKLAETLRGGPRDAPINRVRNAVDVFPTDEATARLAGVLLGRTAGDNTVDALVAAEAVRTGADVLTSDADDLRALLADQSRVTVIPL